MTTPNVALVVMTIPSLDPLLDGTSVSLVYANDGAVVSDLLANCPGLFNVAGAGATQAMYKYMSTSLDRGTDHCTIEVYDITAHLDGSAHGSPVGTAMWTLATHVGGSYVEGVANCVNYRADYGTDVEFGVGTRPRSRDRNRHYFGPLNTDCVTAPSDGTRTKLASVFMTDCLANTKQVEVITGSGPIPDQWNLQVWSRKNASVKPVVEYWCDDRPDYQRRRADTGGVKLFLAA